MFAVLNPLLSMLSALLLPALLLFLALWLEDTALALDRSGLGLLAWFPLLILAVGLFVALRFNRARLLGALLNLLLAYALLVWVLPQLGDFPVAATLGWLMLLLPLNHLLCHFLPDHAAVSNLRYALAAGLAAEGLLIALTGGTEWQAMVAILKADFLSFSSPERIGLSDLGFLAAGFVLAISFARLYSLTNTQRAALFVSSYCIAVMLANAEATGTVIAFGAAAALMLTIAGFQESWNIAYLDQLTELPGRRALEEALAKLDGRFSVSMLDVDHFKKFNDTYGHDVGDQVLRMVASQLRGVGGGGKAYRYGGEEFTVLFPGKTAEEALPYVDELRAAIAAEQFEIRRRDRRAGNADDRQPRAIATGIEISVSAGVAERQDRQQPVADVIKAADEALYAAKRAGRNCVKKARG